jgi:hypothetical protein
MKRALAITAVLLVLASFSQAQELPPGPTQDPSAPYRLFSTTNIYTFLKLDTRDGRIWQVQWGDEDQRFITPLDVEARVPDGNAGRFTLYPTKNIYTFILLDQETGNAWQVQWGGKASDQFVVRVRDVTDILKE